MTEKLTGRCFCGAVRFEVDGPESFACYCHCPQCGSALSYENARRGGEIDIAANCLDDPSLPVPRAHIWTEDKQPWFEIGGDLPVYDRTIG
jgi:hypothetical protein